MFRPAFAMFVLAMCWRWASATPAVRHTTAGDVLGYTSDGVATFNSIPFAEPPIGQLRFRAPQPVSPWAGVRNVSAEPQMCPQSKIEGKDYKGSEDCLYLHVWQPDGANASGTPLPVMLWIYGGAYVMGSSGKGVYDGARLARDRGVVVVAPNYRLGALGFAALYSLQNEDPDRSTGNVALRDQTAALEWTRANIASFGGDPARVHLFGQSAGGFSVAWHLVSRAGAGLFHSATMESGTTDATQFFTPLRDAVAFTELFAASCGCNVTSKPARGSDDPLLLCLRALPTEALLKSVLSVLNPHWPALAEPSVAAEYLPALAPLMAWGPAIDGSDAGLRALPLELIRRGDFNRVPFMLGTNADEGTIFAPAMLLIVPNMTLPFSTDDIVKTITHCLQAFNGTELARIMPTIMANYSVGFQNPLKEADAIITDFFFACSARRTARAIDAFGVPTWLYQFSYNMSNYERYRLLGDYHSAEVPFVFRNQWPAGRVFDSNDWAISDAMSGYWANLATTHDPNDGPTAVPVPWPRYSAASDENLQIAQPLSTTTGLKQGHCDLWDAVLDDLYAHGGVIH